MGWDSSLRADESSTVGIYLVACKSKKMRKRSGEIPRLWYSDNLVLREDLETVKCGWVAPGRELECVGCEPEYFTWLLKEMIGSLVRKNNKCPVL